MIADQGDVRSGSLKTSRIVGTALVILVGFLSAALRTHPMFGGDAGVYFNVEQLLLEGQRLYAEVFDNKDPLFFYVNAIFVALFGSYGPAIAEVCALTLASSVSALVFTNRLLYQAVVACVIPILLTPDYLPGIMAPGLTHTWGLAATVTTAAMIYQKKWILAGVVTGCAGFLEFRSIFLSLIGSAIVLLAAGQRRRSAQRYLVGLTCGLTGILLVLAIRGELTGYLNIFGYNMSHIGSVRDFKGMSRSNFLTTFFGVIREIFISFRLLTIVSILSVIVALLPILAGVRRSRSTQRFRSTLQNAFIHEKLAMFSIVVGLTSLPLAVSTYLFDHHLQLLGIAPTLAVCTVIESLGRARTTWRLIPVVSAVLLGIAIISGPWTINERISNWSTTPSGEIASAISRLNSQGYNSYSIVGEVGEGRSKLSPLPSPRNFRCQLLYQHPWDEALFSSFVDCLRRVPEVVIRSSYSESALAFFPTYRAVNAAIDQVLSECFEEAHGLVVDPYLIFVRRTDCLSNVVYPDFLNDLS